MSAQGGDDLASRRRVAAFRRNSAKALDATVLAQPEVGEAQRMGMNVLVHARHETAAFPMNAMVVRGWSPSRIARRSNVSGGLCQSDLSVAEQ